MGLPPFHLPIRLLPHGSRAPSIPAIGLSLALHGGVLVIVAAGSGRWVTPRPGPPLGPRPLAATVGFVAFGAAPKRPAPNSVRPHGQPASNPGLPPPPQLESDVLGGPVLALAVNRAVVPSDLETAPAGESTTPGPALVDRGSSEGEGHLRIGDEAGPTTAQSGISRVAELRGNPGDACPELRRPRTWKASKDTLAVAVAFMVDTSGRIDRATLRVVQAPGRPAVRTGFVPHIYTVSANARVDRSLPEAPPEYGAIVADDVLSHVSGLRFRPGSRNGRPAQSMVLISCQVS